MLIKKLQIPILIFTLIYLILFLFVFLERANYEFVMYVFVVIFFFVVILFTNEKVNYPNFVLWGLSLWGLLHMCGGGVLLNGEMRLYELMLVNLSSEYSIFRYDQFVHIVGFFVATLVMFVILKPILKKDLKNWAAVSIIVIMAGLGVGALNELIEFLAVVLIPETGVGGFVNTSLDLVSDLIGAILAMVYIYIKKGNL
ncbi:MAG: DUF2238 domain-containing protein [Candidatus Pacearchaeota archaeon]|jgi:putative membrane protein